MDTLGQAFCRWLEMARDARSRQSRSRIWLLFCVLRHTGMRLGEALALDDRTDFDFARSVVCVGGESPREVPIPEDLRDTLQRFVDDPMCAGLRGRVFCLDQGYVRRKFLERDQDTDIPRELLNPRVLRHSRAVELLRGGVPMVVVDAMLGHRSLPQAARYVQFSEADTRRIMGHYMGHSRLKTSARNMFVGQITSARHGVVLSEVEVTTAGGLKVVSVITRESFANLQLELGTTVTATVKAPWVVLVKEDFMPKTSARNKFRGRISAINKGMVAVDVVVDLPDGTKITSLITDESASVLDLHVGDEVCALVKAFSVILTLG